MELLPPSTEEIQALLVALGGLKGASALAIVAVVVQGLMLFFKTKLASFAGKFQLLVVMFLSLLGGVFALKMSGVDWGAAIIHSQTLAALQVFLHQIFKQFLVKKDGDLV